MGKEKYELEERQRGRTENIWSYLNITWLVYSIIRPFMHTKKEIKGN